MKSYLLGLFLLTASSLMAADPTPEQSARIAAVQKLAAGINYREGETTLSDGLAKINVPEKFRYLDSKDASVVLSDIWGNPKDPDILGALVPAGFDPFADNNWLVVITYTEDGYVKDEDAAKIDYTKMLADMQKSTREASEQRVKDGYGAVELVRWAKPPHYEQAAHKLYWAKELKFGEDKENTLNYNIRMLGRRGVLVLNAVASMKQLPEVEAATPAILAMVNFQEGHRYADYNASTDKVATYGLAALVAGGVAAKAGFFKALWIGILAFKKVIIIGAIALASVLKKLIDWIRGRNSKVVATASEPPASN